MLQWGLFPTMLFICFILICTNMLKNANPLTCLNETKFSIKLIKGEKRRCLISTRGDRKKCTRRMLPPCVVFSSEHPLHEMWGQWHQNLLTRRRMWCPHCRGEGGLQGPGLVGWARLIAKVRLSAGLWGRKVKQELLWICHNEYAVAALHYQCMSSPTVESLVQSAPPQHCGFDWLLLFV